MANLEVPSVVYSSTLDRLPPPGEQQEILDWARSNFGEFVWLNPLVVSEVSGCWADPERARGADGYYRIQSRLIREKVVDERANTRLHRATFVLLKAAIAEAIGFTEPEPQAAIDREQAKAGDNKQFHVDHICRNTACCNPLHLRSVDAVKNNSLKNNAQKMEAALLVGQLFAYHNTPWEEQLTEGDSGVHIMSRHGPYKLRVMSRSDRSAYGEPVACPVLSTLRKPNGRKSNRRAIPNLVGQQALVL